MVALLGGCAALPREASSVDGYGVRHIPLALGQTSTGGTWLEHPLPAYPPEWLAQRMAPREVVARLSVDSEGRVSEVSIDGESDADLVLQRLAAEVRGAVLHWTFVPLHANQWAADAQGVARDTGSQVLPFRVAYIFRFAWNGETPTVDVHEAGRPEPPLLRHPDD
ncbi:MAG TPA: hypothetical protein VFG49_05610 [Dyella sp.]|uniref:hypothetical protein n=1 Tax=Dyella sp. TaxID=1869338 RepID=UPI002D770013|nr:hypothetical protein [Dyella sp.]HET6552999.1 hypothetical protein [Dyella sp.]